MPSAEVRTPFVLVQLSDPHIGATWGVGDPVALLADAVAAVQRVRPAPDAVLVTGDLADGGRAEEYAIVKERLAPLGAPIHVLPGNHDDRAALRAAFGLPGEGAAPVHHVTELGPLRLVCLDSTIPGQDGGRLDGDALGWLDATLAAAPAQPAIVALHHGPLVTGVPEADAIGLPERDRRALGEVLSHHAQVRCVAAGHIHWAMTGELGGRRVMVAPSLYVEPRLDLAAHTVEFAERPAGFLVHALRDGELVTYAQAV
jgi:3',5'-cyclic AMP phosphodiesterase CpdA